MDSAIKGKRRLIAILAMTAAVAAMEIVTSVTGYGGMSTNAQVGVAVLAAAFFGGDAAIKRKQAENGKA